METETLGNIGDFLGGIGVLITLVYLAFQIRQNTATTRVQTFQQILSSSHLANVQHSASGRVPNVLQKVLTGLELDDEELAVYVFFVQGTLAQQWQVYYQHQHGMLEDSVFAVFGERNRHFFRGKLFHAIWNNRLSVGYPEEFRTYIQQYINDQ